MKGRKSVAKWAKLADVLAPCLDCGNGGSPNCRYCRGQNPKTESSYWVPKKGETER